MAVYAYFGELHSWRLLIGWGKVVAVNAGKGTHQVCASSTTRMKLFIRPQNG
jgi:hypothetical protein